MVWTHFPDRLHDYLNHINSLRPTTQFSLEVESEGKIPFLDIIVWKGLACTTKFYRKTTHAGHYLNYESNHPPMLKVKLFRAKITELLPYVKSNRNSAMNW